MYVIIVFTRRLMVLYGCSRLSKSISVNEKSMFKDRPEFIYLIFVSVITCSLHVDIKYDMDS